VLLRFLKLLIPILHIAHGFHCISLDLHADTLLLLHLHCELLEELTDLQDQALCALDLCIISDAHVKHYSFGLPLELLGLWVMIPVILNRLLLMRGLPLLPEVDVVLVQPLSELLLSLGLA
jgi:hypothetical protein